MIGKKYEFTNIFLLKFTGPGFGLNKTERIPYGMGVKIKQKQKIV
jgi:hypothetical protein